MQDTSLIGKAKELHAASQLIAAGIYVYFPLVDNGFDLLASNQTGTAFLPVQIKYKKSRTGFTLHRADVQKFEKAGAVVVFGSGGDNGRTDFWYFPIAVWMTRAQDRDRSDEKVAVYLTKDDNRQWASQYLNESGISRAFASLLSPPAAQ